MEYEVLLDKLLKVAYVGKLIAYNLGIDAADDSLILKVLAWAGAFRNAKKYPAVLALALLMFPKFRLGLGRKDADEISPAEHLFRLFAFRKVDVKFAPKVPLWITLKTLALHGLWERHKMEAQLHKATGGAFRMYMPLQRYDWSKPATLVNVLTDVADVEKVLTDKEAFPTRGHTGFTDIVGEGLLGMKTGKKHSSHRAVVIQFLSDNHLRQFGVTICEQIEVLLAKWGCAKGSKNSQPTRINAYYDLSMLTLDVIMLTAFGADKKYLSQHIPEDQNRLAHGLDLVLKDIVIRTAVPFYQYIPTPTQFEINSLIGEANELRTNLFKDAMERIEKEPNAPPTMLSEMLKLRKSNDKDAAGLTDSEIADELQTVRGAGSETTSNTCAWAMLLLARNPHVLEKLREECAAIVKGDTCTFDEAKEIKYAQQVVYETLRLFPTVPSFPRECHKDTILPSGYDVPAGSIIFVSQSALNRDPALWENPNEFIPERFNGAAELAMGRPVGVPNGPRYGFLPFGAAHRSCVGQRLAVVEAVQILASVALRCNWSLTYPNKEIGEVADITLGPKHGLYFDITPYHRTNQIAAE